MDEGRHDDENLSEANTSHLIIDSAGRPRTQFLKDLREDSKNPLATLSARLSRPVNHISDGLGLTIHVLVKMTLREPGSENAPNPPQLQMGKGEDQRQAKGQQQRDHEPIRQNAREYHAKPPEVATHSFHR